MSGMTFLRAVLIAPLMMLWTVQAQADARLSVLVDVLRLPEAAQILRQEGLAYGDDLNTDMLAGQGGAGWDHQVKAIYDTQRMVELVRADLGANLQGEALEQTIDFFASDLGRKIVGLENSARDAIQDAEVESLARDRFAAVEGTEDARLALITAFVTSGDMVERNVTSALNSNYQFMRGLVEGDGLDMTEEEMLSDVMGEVDAIREDTRGWLFGYLMMAYHPLSDDELKAYIAFSETPAGQALNRGLFDGFGKAYEDISYALGRAVALNMTAEEL